jgi:hypothetical protein
MKPITVETHFPWYIDSSDTENIDCQCGHPCNGIAGWADHITKELAMPTGPLQTFAEVWSCRHLVNDLARQMRCEEVEALAGMLRVLGATKGAADWIDAHAAGDDCDDMHCRCETCESVTA